MQGRLIPFFLLLMSTAVFGQLPGHAVQVGIGYPNTVVNSIAAFNALPDILTETFIEGKGQASPQLSLNIDFRIDDKYSIGPYVGYAWASTPTFNWNTPAIPAIPILLPNGLEARDGKYSYDITVLSAGGRFTLHQWVRDNLELYFIGFLGFNQVKVVEKGEQPGQNYSVLGGLVESELVNVPVPTVSYAGLVGGKFMFHKNLGIFLEAGYGMNVLNFGLAYRFNRRNASSSNRNTKSDDVDSSDLKRSLDP